MNEGREVMIREHVETSLADLATMAKSIAASRMFGVETEDQAMALMLLCQAEGLHPIMALRRYHIIEGKPAYRADALQGEFERDGGILWHERSDTECSATFFRSNKGMDSAAVERAKLRYKLLKENAYIQTETCRIKAVAQLATPGELTIVRTIEDANEKKLSMSFKDGKWVLKKNWRQSPRQMLHARCLTEGVRAINPGLVAGIYSEDEIHDMVVSPEDEDQRTHENGDAMRKAIAERNVREATANATGACVTESERIACGTNDYGPTDITQDNYTELKSHIGKAQGDMLGRKVGEFPRAMIDWMYNKWREGLGPSASEQDLRLKKAIEFAKENLNAVDAVCNVCPKCNAVLSVGEVHENCPANPGKPSDVGSKQASIAWLRNQIDDMVMTEETFCKYVSSLSVVSHTDNKTVSEVMRIAQSGNAATAFDQLSEDQLLVLSQNWKVIRAAVETLIRPTPSTAEPKKKKYREPKGRKV